MAMRTGSSELDRKMLRRALELAEEGQRKGSSPVGALLLGPAGEILAEGFNRVLLPWEPNAHRIGQASVAHAEMDVLFQVGKPERPEECTFYTSLEPCIMCGGAIGMLAIGRVVWACDDPWGGSGRLIGWNEHPAYKAIRVEPHPFPDLEAWGAALFAPEARKAYPQEGWSLWKKRYPQACAEVETTLPQ